MIVSICLLLCSHQSSIQ